MVSPTQTKAIIVVLVLAVVGVSTAFTIVEFSRQSGRLILATTTSTYDSGLLDEIVPAFEQRWGVQVDIVSVGTGQALTMGRSGDCDVLMVHSRAREDAFVSEGYGIHRVTVWWNDFIIVGPSADPANINGLENATEAFIRIYNAGEAGNSTFYSRGDGSGTESKEVAIWGTTGLGRPDNNTQFWYKKTGLGMGDLLVLTNEKDGYTLTDRGTWLARMDALTFLTLHAENDTILLNPYGVILVDPGRFPNVNLNLAVKFVAYLCSSETQAAVDAFGKNDQPMFHACYGTGNATSLLFDTDEQVQEQVHYWGPLIQLYYP